MSKMISSIPRQDHDFLDLLQSLARSSNAASDVEEILKTALDQICEYTGWPVARASLPDKRSPSGQASSCVWHLKDPKRWGDFPRMIEEEEQHSVETASPKEPMAGDDGSSRRSSLQIFGLSQCCVIPLRTEERTTGVLEFFSDEPQEPDELRLRVMETLGVQLGGAMEHKRVEEELLGVIVHARCLLWTATIRKRDSDGGFDWETQVSESEAAQQVLPLDASSGKSYTDAWQSSKHPEDMARIHGNGAAALDAGRSSFQQEYRCTDKYGETHWLREDVSLRSLGPHCWQAVGVCTDVSEAKRAEEMLRLRDRVIGSVQEGILITDPHQPDNPIIYANPGFERLTGYGMSEILGENCRFLQGPETDRVRVTRIRDAVRERRSVTDEILNYRKDGTSFWNCLSITPVRDEEGSVTHFVGVQQDVTERKQAEAEVRDLMTHARCILWYADIEMIEGRYVWQFHMPDEAAAQRVIPLDVPPNTEYVETWVLKRHPDDQAEMHDRSNEALDLGKPSYSQEYRCFDREGTIHWLFEDVSLESLGPLRWRAVGVCTDVTERKWFEEELASTRDAALEAARLKSEFLANVSHEIRTPLNAVIGMTGLLLDTPLTREQREYAETVQNSGEGLLSIINEVLDFSKIEAGKASVTNAPFDLNRVVEEMLDLVSEPAQAKGIEIASLIHEDVPTALEGDAGRLRQVLINLVGNAVKFTEHGEVVLQVRREFQTEQREFLRFSISDTGIGIAEEVQPLLFQPFMQADGSTTRKYGGTGLGLAICRQLIEAMGGEVHLESEVGRGSTFWFVLPFESQSVTLETPVPARRDLTGLRVLIVDDNATNRRIVRHQVALWGMIDDEAENGALAFEKLRRRSSEGTPYDLALLDMQMPEMDGLMLAETIRAHPSLEDVRLVMMTSLGQRDETALQRAGIAASLTKPVKQSQLYDCLVKVMAGVEYEKEREMPNETVVPRHARILLAEDNPVNRKVAMRQLQRLGYTVEAVENGREALDTLKRESYDLVLMDCQMPEMDGYQATAEIRKWEGAERRTPVIAMTANALHGEREKCLAVGMDDYLSKPVKLEDLDRVVQKWTPAIPLEELPEVPLAEEVAQYPILDPRMLANLRDLQEEGEPDILIELTDTFLGEVPLRLAALGTAIEQDDGDAVRKLAHNIKGSSNCLGGSQMAQAALALESLVGPLDQTHAGELYMRLNHEFTKMKNALEMELVKSGL